MYAVDKVLLLEYWGVKDTLDWEIMGVIVLLVCGLLRQIDILLRRISGIAAYIGCATIISRLSVNHKHTLKFCMFVRHFNALLLFVWQTWLILMSCWNWITAFSSNEVAIWCKTLFIVYMIITVYAAPFDVICAICST